MVLIPTAGLVGAGAAVLAMYGVAILLYAIIKTTRQYVLDWLQLSWAPIAVTSLAAFLLRAFKPYYPMVWIGGLALSLPLLWFLLSSTPADLWWRWRLSRELTKNEI
jgi:hypothetical protein